MIKMRKIKVTLYFKSGGKMTFKCKEFEATKNKDRTGYSSCSWEKANPVITFVLGEVIAIEMKKVLF
jgi:hypothetical protein